MSGYTAPGLRSDIRKAELAVAALSTRTPAGEVIELFELLDRIAEGYEHLAELGVDLRPEATRIETVYNTLHDKARMAVRALSSRDWDELRSRVGAGPERWWWYLDREVAARSKERLKKLVRGLLIGGVLLALMAIVYLLFFRPDEVTRMRYDYVMQAEVALRQSDYATALEYYQKALRLAPDDPELCLMVGVMNEALGNPGEAEKHYARAESLYGGRAFFLAMRSQKYAILGWYDKCEADARAAVEADGNLPLAYCALGTAYEGQDRIPEAIRALQKCAELAHEQGQDELYVVANSRLAILLQKY